MNKTIDKDREKELQEYRALVHRLAKNQVDVVFHNSDEDHALIVLTELFEHAKKRVRIFAGALVGSLGSQTEYIFQLVQFIRRGGHVQILLNDFDAERAKGSALYFYLYILQKKPEYQRQVEVKQTSQEITMSTPDHDEDVPVHFTIGDDKAYRLEVDIENRESRCNFNSSGSMLQRMIAIFDETFAGETSTSIDLSTLL